MSHRNYRWGQAIWWRTWHGLRWVRWTGGLDRIYRGSLLLGWLELRFWR